MLCVPSGLSDQVNQLTQAALVPQEASKIIFFNTGPAHQLGVHYGSLAALAAINIGFLILAIWFQRWRGDKAERKKLEQQSKEREKKA